MNIKSITSTFTKPRVLAPIAFLSIGVGKISYDYNTAKATLEKNIGRNIANGEVELKQDNCKGKKKSRKHS